MAGSKIVFSGTGWPVPGSVPMVLTGQELAHVACVHLSGGHSLERIVDDLCFAELLKIEKEKCLVAAVEEFGNPDRTTQREAVIVLARTGPQQVHLFRCR